MTTAAKRNFQGASGMLLILIATMLLGLALSHWREKKRRHDAAIVESSSPVFTTTVDWYKPPLESPYDEHGVEVPHELVGAVSRPLREEAAALLGGADIILLTKDQAARLSSTSDPDTVLQERIEARTEKLNFFHEHPIDETDILKRYGKHEVEEQKQSRQRIMEDFDSEIKRLREWKNQLKPYLIKAVALQAGGSFGGTLISEDLLISYGAMGSHAVPMERCPVVAFLPKKPRKVYTAVGMMQ